MQKIKPKQVTKLIIPLAGFGTRFLPVSKNYPKEMINLVDRPVIQYLVEEAHESGIKEIIFVLNYSKDIIPQYFSKHQHPHQKKAYQNSSAAKENLAELDDLLSKIKFHKIKKTTTLGDGHSILFAKSKIGAGEPFAVTMGDLLSPPGKPFLKQLIQVYQKTGAPVISVEKKPRPEVNKFGVIAPQKSDGRLHLVGGLVEKPKPEEAPSTMVLTGKYILTPAIFREIQKVMKNPASGEVRLADALASYAKNNTLYAYECEGKIQDTGNKLDFLKATVEFAAAHKVFGADFKKFLQSFTREV